MVDVSRRDAIVCKKILREISDIESFIAGMAEESFYADVKTQKAVVMSLINIGELTKSLSEDYIMRTSKIPWRKVQALRNIAAHKYEAIYMQIVWDTVKISIAELRMVLSK